jgi:hypothetical protein
MSIRKQPVPVRITITLPYRVSCGLRDRADHEGRSVSNLAAFLLEDALAVPREKPAPSRLMVDVVDQGRSA